MHMNKHYILIRPTEQENTNLGLIPWINWVWKESTNYEQENKHVLQMQRSNLYLEAQAS